MSGLSAQIAGKLALNRIETADVKMARIVTNVCHFP